jgi:hypothetical protein
MFYNMLEAWHYAHSKGFMWERKQSTEIFHIYKPKTYVTRIHCTAPRQPCANTEDDRMAMPRLEWLIASLTL